MLQTSNLAVLLIFFLLFPFLVFTKSQLVLNLRVDRSIKCRRPIKCKEKRFPKNVTRDSIVQISIIGSFCLSHISECSGCSFKPYNFMCEHDCKIAEIIESKDRQVRSFTKCHTKCRNQCYIRQATGLFQGQTDGVLPCHSNLPEHPIIFLGIFCHQIFTVILLISALMVLKSNRG